MSGPATSAAGGAPPPPSVSWKERMQREQREAASKYRSECEDERAASLACSNKFPEDKDERCGVVFATYRSCMDAVKERTSKTRGLSTLFKRSSP